jgi:hypothetical protein
MKLPESDKAVVDIAKLRDYCLSGGHVRGRHKARVFASILGLTSVDAEFLRNELLRAARGDDATAGHIDEYGARYTIDFEVIRNHRQSTIRSAWIVLNGETVPRLTSCYVLLD